MALNDGPNAIIRFVGGPANDLVLTVPADKVPRFFGVGKPIARYEPVVGVGEVQIFRYVPSDAS